MRNGPSSTILATAASWRSRVSSWLGGRLLLPAVPIQSGRVTSSAGANVPDSVKIVVPRFPVVDGAVRDLLPTTADAPLARYGQQLDITLTVAGVDTRIGRFQISDWDYDEDTITVNGAGLLQIASDARLLEPTQPRTGGTLKSEFLRLLPSTVSAQFAAGLVDRACPPTMTWDEDRLGALYEIADAWPAVLRMDAFGQVQVKAPPTATGSPVMFFKDGKQGTVVRAPRKDSRAGAYNIVVARSSADGVVASGRAVQTSGPMAVATYNPVPRFYSSPLLLTDAQCNAAAAAMLASSMRASSILTVEAAPDPRLELDDLVEVRRDGFRDWGLVVGVDMPLTSADGAMRFDVGVA